MARHNWVTWTVIDRDFGAERRRLVLSTAINIVFPFKPVSVTSSTRKYYQFYYIFISKNRTEICKTKKHNNSKSNQKMKRMEREEECLKQELEELQKQLGKKLKFEEAVSSLNSLLQDRYPSASPSLHRLV